MEKKSLDGSVEQPERRQGQAFVFGAFHFNVDRGLAAVAEVPRQSRPVEVGPWARFFGFDVPEEDGIALFAPRHLNPEYAMTTDLDEPLLVATLRGEEGRHYPLLIDGTHRVYKAYALGVGTLPAYVLDEQESLAIRDDPFVGSTVYQPDRDPDGRDGGTA